MVLVDYIGTRLRVPGFRVLVGSSARSPLVSCAAGTILRTYQESPSELTALTAFDLHGRCMLAEGREDK
jgi:hypothetical protein